LNILNYPEEPLILVLRRWTKYGNDGSMQEVPSAEAIKKSVEKVGYKNILLDSAQTTIFLRKEGMKIGFGSIGKGYAADQGKMIAQKAGIMAGIGLSESAIH